MIKTKQTMKTTSKFITASLITAVAATILFTSCKDPQPANDAPPVDTVNTVPPVDTSAAAPVDTAASQVDTTDKQVSERK